MLNKSLLIGLENLRPHRLSEGVLIRELLELSVCDKIRKHVLGLAYNHLPIYYNYSQYSIENANLESILEHYYITDTDNTLLTELFTVNYMLDRTIEDYLEEYNIFFKNNTNTILNFNSAIINRNSFILSTEILARD